MAGDAEPFGVDGGGGDGRAAGAGEPVGGVAGVALDEMEEGVDP